MRTHTLSSLLVAVLMAALVAPPSNSADHGDPAGIVALTVVTADPGAFGYASGPPSAFSGSFRLLLEPPLPPDPIPDGDHEATFADFQLSIGNNSWDATMPHDPPLVRFQGGVPIGWVSTFTLTRPDHPDLLFASPNSPGTWEAIDDDGVSNNGSIGGTYELVAPAAPAIGLAGWAVASTLLLIVTAFALATRRFRRVSGRGLRRSGSLRKERALYEEILRQLPYHSPSLCGVGVQSRKALAYATATFTRTGGAWAMHDTGGAGA